MISCIETPLEAWLTFLSEDDPERIITLITKYPEFKAMYETSQKDEQIARLQEQLNRLTNKDENGES